MTLSTTAEFPESTLAGDRRKESAQTGSSARVSRRLEPYKSENRILKESDQGRGVTQDNLPTRRGDRPPHLSSHTIRTPVDIDRHTLVSLGRTKGRTNDGFTAATRGTHLGQEADTTATNKDIVEKPHAVPGRGQQEEVGTRFLLHSEPPEAHPSQLKPTLTAYNLAQLLYKQDPGEWRLEDVHTPGSPEGTSVLLSAFVDFAATTLQPGMTSSQQLSLAQILKATDPGKILALFRNHRLAHDFVAWAIDLNTPRPPQLEDLLCPMVTPGLIQVEGLSTRMADMDLLRSEQLQIIKSFVGCYYARSATSTLEAIRHTGAGMLQTFISKPGEIARDMRSRKRTMAFAPPRWYRLSMNPDTVRHSSPRTQKRDAGTNEEAVQITLNELGLKLNMSIAELAIQPLSIQKTEILSALPKIYGDRISQDGFMTTLQWFHSATQDEIGGFLQGGKFEAPLTTQSATAIAAPRRTQWYLYNIKLMHTDRKMNGKWKKPAVDILLCWVNAIYSGLREHGHRLILTNPPLATNKSNTEITASPYMDVGKLAIHLKAPQKETKRFDVWLKSSHDDLGQLTNQSPPHTKNALAEANITTKVLSRNKIGGRPILMLIGSIDTDSDDMICHELEDRLVSTGTPSGLCPKFYVATRVVDTHIKNESIKIKCVVTHPDAAHELKELFAQIPTPASRSRYLVTRDFFFTAIGFPSTTKSVRAVQIAMKRQHDFTASLATTTIHGLNIDPFYYIPETTIDMSSGERGPNRKTLAELILLAKGSNNGGRQSISPVNRVTVSPSLKEIHLFGLKTDIMALIQYTNDLRPQIVVWFGDLAHTTMCDTTEAQRLLNSLRTAEKIKFVRATAATTLTQSTDDGDEKYNMKHGIGTTDVDSFNTVKRDISDLREIVVAHNSRTGDLHDMVQWLVQKGSHDGVQEGMINTITTAMETTIQSSLSATTHVAYKSYSEQMIEWNETLVTQLGCIVQRLDLMLDKAQQDSGTMGELYELVSRQGTVTAQTRDEILEMRKIQSELQLTVTNTNLKMRDGTSPAPLSRRLGTNTQTEIHGQEDAGAPKKVATSMNPVATQEYAPGELTSPLDHNAIRERAVGVLNLMDSMPCTWVGRTSDRSPQERDPTHIQPILPQTSLDNTVCVVCNKSDLGLLLCDRCIEPTSLYHPHCLSFLPDTNERICDMCNGTQTSPTNPFRDSTQNKTSDLTAVDKPQDKIFDTNTLDNDTSASTSSASTAHDSTQTSPALAKAIDIQQGKIQGNESLDDATSASSSSSSISAYSPKYRTRATQLSATAPPYLTQANTDRHTRTKTSPRLTRAAKRAAKIIPPINYGETDDDSDNNDTFQ